MWTVQLLLEFGVCGGGPWAVFSRPRYLEPVVRRIIVSPTVVHVLSPSHGAYSVTQQRRMKAAH